MTACPHEASVAAAARHGRWTDELRRHCADCAECADTALVSAFLQQEAREIAAADAPLPDPRLLWIRAQAEERRELLRRATSPIAWLYRVAALAAAGLAGVAVTFPGTWGLLRETALRWTGLPTVIVVPVLGLLSLMLVFAAVAACVELASRDA
ncbi:MAG: hypothetical protein KBD01_08000 [Acidobacteria bacterium]|nr:hypothetical protein [Acidobacteriota bacterium]